MKHTRSLLAAATAALALDTQAALFSGIGTGSSDAGLSTPVNDFKAAIGGANNGANNTLGTEFTTGRREINWDAAALPAAMPANFFNVNSRRGAVFSTDGSGFQVSENSASSVTRKFGNVDAGYVAEFSLFSPQRLFAAAGSVNLEATFFQPNITSQAATITAFGAIFVDVDLANTTKLELIGAGGVVLASGFAPVNNQGLSFLGLTLDPGQVATSVRITSGNLALGLGNIDDPTHDVVAMDDFFYSEPQALTAVPEPQEWAALAGGACLLLGVARKLRRDTQA